MTPAEEQKYREAIKQALNMSSPEFSFSRLLEKLSKYDLDSEYLHSGKTCRQVIEENRVSVDFHKRCLVYLDGLFALSNKATAEALGVSA